MRLATSHLAATVCCIALIAICEGFDADSGSRGHSQDAKERERTLLLPLGLLALWKLKPLWKTFAGNFNGYGSFGGTFGGGGYYSGQQYYPFIPGGVGVGGVGIQAGVGGVGYPGYFPAGYPYPIVAGPFGQQQTSNRRGQPKPRPTQITVEDVSRVDENINSEIETSTTGPTKVDEDTESPGLVQSIREFTSPLFHAGQRVESRANSRYRSSTSLG